MKYYVALTLILGLFALPAMSFADSEPIPQDYTITTPDGRYIFVMLVPQYQLDFYGTSGVDPLLREKYTQSGLYENQTTPTLVYAVDWYAFAFWQTVYLSSDGRYITRIGPWPNGGYYMEQGNYAELAVAFYVDGKELKRYRVLDLVADPPKLPHSISHYQWLDDAVLNEQQGLFTITTLNGESYVFDIRTGEIISRAKSWSSTIYLALSVLAILLGYIAIVRGRAK